MENLKNPSLAVADEIEDAINSYSPHIHFENFDKNESENFDKIVSAYIYEMQFVNYDSRNEASVILAKKIADKQEPFGIYKEVARKLCCMHRTLQQNFMRLCMEWKEYNGEQIDYCLPFI